MTRRGRPPLALGTFGRISVTGEAAPYSARARYRDRDGTVRDVVRTGQTKGAAERSLRAALAERVADMGDVLTRSTSIDTLAGRWLEEVRALDRARQTVEHYQYVVDRYVLPRIGQLRLAEATTGRLDDLLASIGKKHGPGAAASTRAVLNGMFGLAVRHDALPSSPVRETRPIRANRKAARALTVDETDAITDLLRSSKLAVRHDLPDLVEWCLATGCRIGEALAVRDAVLDLDGGTVEINATIISIKGEGLQVQERPKTAAGWRVLALPSYAVEMVKRRRTELRFAAPQGVLFGSPFADTLRDPSNTGSRLREVLDPAGFDWVTFHTFRRTVATRLDEAGWTPRQVADQLGHSQPSMTLDRYMGRRVVNADAARVLDR